MATSFGWKRKRKAAEVASSTASIFKEEGVDGEESVGAAGVDWLMVNRKRRCFLLEDNLAKSKRLQDQGSLLAESGKYWEALKYWNEALELTPGSAILHEMKSQVLATTVSSLCVTDILKGKESTSGD